MGEKGPLRFVLAVCLLLCLTFLLQEVTASNGQDEGTWYIGEDRVIESENLTLFHDIVVNRSVTLIIIGSTITMTPDVPGTTAFIVKAGATLTVSKSTLILDGFLAEEGTSLEFSNGSRVTTTGSFIARSGSFVAHDTEFRNVAPDGGSGESGGNATFIANGDVNGECMGVTIENHGGNASKATAPGCNGSAGGSSVLSSNVSIWVDCVVECTAGTSAPGGLDITGNSGGSGGLGGDVEIHMFTQYLENVVINGNATDGGNGARGAENPAGNAGDGGDGADGGNVLISIDSTEVLELYDINILATSGLGGSGGNGGEATNGDGGVAGYGANAGTASIEVHCMDDIYLEDSAITALGGEGGYGGGYGRHLAGSGAGGIPRPGGDGGMASIVFDGKVNLFMNRVEVMAHGGVGLDGGAGYEQGETGGAGSDGIIRFRTVENVEGVDVTLEAFGGNGGYGGISYSGIVGNGGDGGDPVIEYSGLEEMNLERFYIFCVVGRGGKGNSLPWDGFDGIATFDLDTQYLTMREVELNQPLDDLHGNAEVYLYNVSFDLTNSIVLHPSENVQVWTFYPVTVRVTDNPDPSKAGPRVGYQVTVISIKTGAVVAEGITDESGECHFELVSFHYTSQSVDYEGSYHFIATSPDGKLSRRVRGEIQGPKLIIIAIPDHWMPLFVSIIVPIDDSNLVMDKDNRFLETFGYVFTEDENVVTSVFFHLYPEDDDPGNWRVHELDLSPVPLSELENPDDRWGKFFPPEEHSNRWQWFMRYEIVGGDIEYWDELYLMEITAGDGFNTGSANIFLWIDIEEVRPAPLLELNSPSNGSVWTGQNVTIAGLTESEYGITQVELSFDNGSWVGIGDKKNWTYTISTDILGLGNHNVRVRAFDGLGFSSEAERWFVVELDSGNGNGGDGTPDDSDLSTADTALLALAILLLAVGVYGFVASRLRKDRTPRE